MADLEYYNQKNNDKYLASIDLSQIKSSKEETDCIFICILDKSGSMGNNTYKFVKEIFPKILELLKCETKESILITYDNEAKRYSGNAEYYKSQNITSGGGTELYPGLIEFEKIIDDYIKLNKKLSIRLLTTSDGDIGYEENLYNKIDELILKIKNNLIINSHTVRYFTSDSPPDTTGLSSMCKLNNVPNGKGRLIDIKSEDSDEINAKLIANLFMNDGLDNIYKITSKEKNLYETPWSEPSSELLLKSGTNLFWCNNLNNLQINDSNDKEIETNKKSKGMLNQDNYTEILEEKFVEIKKKAAILQIANNQKSKNELKVLISNIETFEIEITGKNGTFCEQIKQINDINFGNQDSNQIADYLESIGENLNWKKENEELKKKINFNELFLCPLCLKKIPLFISFDITPQNKIFINYICSCNNKLENIELNNLLYKWNENKNKTSKCNSHSAEGKYCLKCNKWLCLDCILVHDDITKNHKDLITKFELILNNKCNKHKGKNKNGFCCTCYEEICSTCAGYFNDGHIKYTHMDKWKDIFNSLDFHTIREFEKIVDKMNKKILNYKNDQIKKLDIIIEKINNLKANIEKKYKLIENNNMNLTKYFKNLLKTFIVYEDLPSYIVNENTSKFQFHKNFFVVEKESNNTFEEISRATLETFETCNLYQLMYFPEIKIDEELYKLKTNEGDISSIIQLKDGTILTGHYDKKKVSFYSYDFKKIEDKEICTKGNVTNICELDDKLLAIGNTNPDNIIIYKIDEKNIEEIKILEGHSGIINSIINLNNNYLVSGGLGGSYEIFIWDKKNNFNLTKISGHSNNINCIIKLYKDDYFASCSDDKTIIIWQNGSRKSSRSYSNPIKQMIQLKNQKIACVDSSRNIYILNENNNTIEKTINSGHYINSNINKMICLKDSRILTCSDDKHINIFDPENYKCLNYNFSFSFNNDSPIKSILQTLNYQIISGDSNGILKVWTPQIYGNYVMNRHSNLNSLFNGSLIIADDEKEMVYNWIEQNPNAKLFKTELLYRLTRDGDTPQAFHSNCDNKGTTIIFIKNYYNEYRFGGYTTVPWKGNNSYQPDSKAFVFSLTKRKKFPIKNASDRYAVGHYKDYGPIFGGDTDIYFHSGGNWSAGTNASCNPSNYSCNVMDMIGANSSSCNFRVGDFEVWLIK